MYARQDPQDLQDHRAYQGLPDPLVRRGRGGEPGLSLPVSPVEISIPAGSVYVGIVRLALGSLARSAGFDEERVDDIRIAVSEVCTNAVLGREDATERDAITVTWREDDGNVVVEVNDRGRGDAATASPTDSQGFSSRLVMSEALLREMADDLTVEARPDGGTSTRLAFSLA